MLMSALATMALAIPLRMFGLGLPEPVFPMVLAFAWAVIRPSVLGPFALLAIGLFNDLFWDCPLGLWPVSLLVAYFVVLLSRSLMAGQSNRVMWGWYIAVSLLSFGSAYGFTVAISGVTPNLLATGLQFVVTIALYPLAHWLIDQFEDADVRFR
jgi:rod shape-determining protein MreD